jgi:hypothetical protein
MLVDMVPLRRGNSARPRADVETDTPMRGDLEFTMTRDAWDLDRSGDEPSITARLTPPGLSGSGIARVRWNDVLLSAHRSGLSEVRA